MVYNDGTDPTLAELITAKFIPEVFSKNTIMHVMSNLVVANCCNTTYKKDLVKGYVVSIPVWSEVTTAEVTPGTEATAIDAANATPASITVDRWRVAKIEESEMMLIEDHIDYLTKGAESCAYAIAKDVDTKCGSLFSTLAGSSVQGSDGQTLTDDIILALLEYLDSGDVPDKPRYLIADPSSKVDVLKIDKFVRNDYIKGSAPIMTGQFGEIYGMPFLITNNLTAASTGNYGVMMHQDAIGLVLQANPYSQRIPMPWVHQTIYQVKVIYGAAEIRDTFGKSFYTRSA